ncbi:MAG: phage tail protein [Ferruginibacter sp.]
MEGTIGEIRLFAADFAPRNWAYCNAQLLSIASNTALFSILGTTYGGNGQVTFGLPDFRGRTAVGTGTGAGLSNVQMGQLAGTESITILTSNLPAHTHTLSGTLAMPIAPVANAVSLRSNYPAIVSTGNNFYDSVTDNATLAPVQTTFSSSIAGSSSPITQLQPYLAINYIICLFGIFPSRN